MKPTDRKSFNELLEGFFAVIGTRYNPDVMPWWFEALAAFELKDIRVAMQAYTADPKRERGPVMPGTILGYLPSPYGHPTPEQAWNHLPKSEHDGGYVTNLMMEAFADCSDSLNRGDFIGGRKAFLESYAARVRAAETQRQHAVFFYSQPSEGNREQRLQLKETKTIEALKNGWLTHEKAKNVLAAICDELAKPLPLALERISGIVTGARIPGATSSLRIESKSSETSAAKLGLMEAFGEIKAKREEERQRADEAKAEQQRIAMERRNALLAQADAILGRQGA
jgi:hypothetical protein